MFTNGLLASIMLQNLVMITLWRAPVKCPSCLRFMDHVELCPKSPPPLLIMMIQSINLKFCLERKKIIWAFVLLLGPLLERTEEKRVDKKKEGFHWKNLFKYFTFHFFLLIFAIDCC